MARARFAFIMLALAAWWLLFGAAAGIGISWTTKALAERGLARGPRWAASVQRPWPHSLLPGYQSPDDWMRVTEWWRQQDIGTWRSHPEFIIIEASYGLPFRSVGELIVQQQTGVGPMQLDIPGTTPQTGPLAGMPQQIRLGGFLGNTLIYATLGWWLMRGRRSLRARRRHRTGRCPECGDPWSGVGIAGMCSACHEWRTRPRVRTWYWWKSTLNAPWWLAVGAALTLLIAWGGPYAGLYIGDHFISQVRRPADSWPSSGPTRNYTIDYLDPANCWWGCVENYHQGWQLFRVVRAGSPFPCCSGIWDAIPKPTAYGIATGAIGPHRDVWVIKIPKVGDIALPNRFLWAGFALDLLFWSCIAWALWRGPAAVRRWRWRRTGRCGTCGYDLRGLHHGARCPECGTIPAGPWGKRPSTRP